MVPRTKACPGGELAGAGEPAHVPPGLSDDDLGRASADARHVDKPLDGGLEGLDAGLDFSGERRDGGVEEVDVLQDLSGCRGVVGVEVTGQRLGQLGEFVPKPALGQSG